MFYGFVVFNIASFPSLLPVLRPGGFQLGMARLSGIPLLPRLASGLGAPAGLRVGKMEELNPSHQGMTGEVEIGTPGVKKIPVLYQQMRNHIK